MDNVAVDITHKGYKCQKCNHTWIPRLKGEKPHTCPKCKSVRWDEAKK